MHVVSHQSFDRFGFDLIEKEQWRGNIPTTKHNAWIPRVLTRQYLRRVGGGGDKIIEVRGLPAAELRDVESERHDDPNAVNRHQKHRQQRQSRSFPWLLAFPQSTCTRRGCRGGNKRKN